jgi:SAM-dependent methyltransferase
MLWKSQREALNAPTGDIKLAFCQQCGYIGNVLFEPDKIRYDQEYTFSMYFSPTFREFINSVILRLVERYHLRDKTILEIGCGEGDFLRLFCELGQNHGVGIDPIATSHVELINGRQVAFIQDWYTEKYANQEVDLICCRQALDQLPQPKKIVELIRLNIGRRNQIVTYVEVPNATAIFEDMLIRNIMYEKSSWFTLYSLTRLFELSGFEVLSVEPCFDGGQYLGIEAIPALHAAGSTASSDELTKFAQSVATFETKHRQKIKNWEEQLSVIRQLGQRVIAWGSGAGGINFFSTLRITKEEIPFVIDINPKRQGRFLPLTGQQVMPPEFLQQYTPDVVIITNATYEQEIRQQISAMGIHCNFWVI